MLSDYAAVTKSVRAPFTPNGVYFGIVKRVDGETWRAWVEIPRLAEGYDFGPVAVTTLTLPTVGDQVTCVFVENRTDDFVVVGIVQPQLTPLEIPDPPNPEPVIPYNLLNDPRGTALVTMMIEG